MMQGNKKGDKMKKKGIKRRKGEGRKDRIKDVIISKRKRKVR